MVAIFSAHTEDHYQAVRDLTAEYIAWDVSRTADMGLEPDVLLRFQYGHGHDAIPGDFSPPRGCLLLATDEDRVAGCGAFHRWSDDICEMKRVFVRPRFRGRGIGRGLASTLVSTAAAAGYRLMRLETVTFMVSAISLYESLGFRRCEPYYEIPASFLPVTLFMELALHGSAA